MDVLQDFSAQPNLFNVFTSNSMNFRQQEIYPFQKPLNFEPQCLPYNNAQTFIPNMHNMQPHFPNYFGFYCQNEQPYTTDLQQMSQNFKASLEQNTARPQNPDSKKKWFTVIRDETRTSFGEKIKEEEEEGESILIKRLYEDIDGYICQRRKYITLSKAEKSEIQDYLREHGVDKTWKMYGDCGGKLTKRKLRLWHKKLDMVIKKKGKTTSDPQRDQALYEWYYEFLEENGKAPDRREVKKKALEFSTLADFKASKGWLDKFVKRKKVDLSPVKAAEPTKQEGKKSHRNSRKLSEGSDEMMVKEESPVSDSTAYSHTFLSQEEVNSSEKEVKQSHYSDFFSDINLYFNFGGDKCSSFDKKDEIPSFEAHYPFHNTF